MRVFTCDHCQEVFTNKQNLTRHVRKYCKAKEVCLTLLEKYEASQARIKDLELKNKRLEFENCELREQVKKLQKRPTTVINNDNRKVTNNINLHIENYIKESPKCVSYDVLSDYVPRLKINHLIQGGYGLAKYFIDNILPDVRMITTDKARSVVVYLKDGNKIYTDCKLHNFIVIFSRSIKDRAGELMNGYITEMNLDLTDEDDMALHRKYLLYVADIGNASDGNEPRFAPAFCKRIHSATLSKNLIKA